MHRRPCLFGWARKKAESSIETSLKSGSCPRSKGKRYLKNRWVALWLKFVIIQGNLYYILMRQCSPITAPWTQAQQQQADQPDGGAREPRRHLATNQSTRPLNKLKRMDSFMKTHFKISTAIYCFLLIKYLFIDSFSFKGKLSFLADYYYLDCLLIGRFRFVGRTNRMSGEILLVFVIMFSVYRFICLLFVPQHFKFVSIEFLLYDYEDVLMNEIKSESLAATPSLSPMPGYHQEFSSLRTMPSYLRAHERVVADCNNQTIAFGKATKYKINQEFPLGLDGANKLALFYLREHFDANVQERLILRPNRSAESWLKLNECTCLLSIGAVCTIVGWLLLMYYTLGGSVLTNLGFELSYPTCVTWLRDCQLEQANATNPATGATSNLNCSTPKSSLFDLTTIYQTPRVLGHERPLDQIPSVIPLEGIQQMGWYNLARLLADLVENHLVYIEFIDNFVCLVYVNSINSFDVILNARQIKRRLEQLIHSLEQRQSHQRASYRTYDSTITITGPMVRAANSARWRAGGPAESMPTIQDHDVETLEQIDKIQAILTDHFELVKSYNAFISFFTTIYLLCWLLATMTVCSWMATIKSRSTGIEKEFAMAEIGGTMVAFFLTVPFAITKSENTRLYPLISRAMALDLSDPTKKHRWSTIIKHFYPRPLYCFAIFGSSEISWLFCLKLVSWVMSAFVVMANFFYMDHL